MLYLCLDSVCVVGEGNFFFSRSFSWGSANENVFHSPVFSFTIFMNLLAKYLMLLSRWSGTALSKKKIGDNLVRSLKRVQSPHAPSWLRTRRVNERVVPGWCLHVHRSSLRHALTRLITDLWTWRVSLIPNITFLLLIRAEIWGLLLHNSTDSLSEGGTVFNFSLMFADYQIQGGRQAAGLLRIVQSICPILGHCCF